MRHRVKKASHREHDIKNLAVSIVLYGKVQTSKSKAKDVKPVIDKIISKAKKMDKVTAIRYLNSYLPDKLATKKIVDVLAPEYANRDSGYTRIIPSHTRKGDGAEIVTIMLTPNS